MSGSTSLELQQKKDWHSLGGRQFKNHAQEEEHAAMMALASVFLDILKTIAQSTYLKFDIGVRLEL
jgi:hypothetical protein